MRLGRGRCRFGLSGAGRQERVRCAVGLACANLRQQERPDPLKGSKAGWRDVTSPTARVRFDGIPGAAQAGIACCKAEFKCGRRGVTSSRLEGRRTYLGQKFQQPRWQSISTVREGVTCASMSHPAAMSRRKTRGRCKSPCRAIALVRMNLMWRAVARPWATLPAPRKGYFLNGFIGWDFEPGGAVFLAVVPAAHDSGSMKSIRTLCGISSLRGEA